MDDSTGHAAAGPHAMRRRAPLATTVPALLLAIAASQAVAAELRVRVSGTGDGGTARTQAPLDDAVASLHPVTGGAPTGGRAVLDQRDATFVPGVLPVGVGTHVAFPNSDNTLHHVYSFSPAKRFELPLYSGRQAEPVVFDKEGVVTLGCNIHDWMVAHVVVLDTPYFARTGADGSATIEAPPGDYTLRVWHARQRAPFEAAVRIGDGVASRDVRLSLAPPVPQVRPGASRLLELQERLRSTRQGTPERAPGSTRR
jgi:plastocyanin